MTTPNQNAATPPTGNGADPATPAVVPPANASPANGAPPANPLEDLVAKLANQVETLSKSVNSLHATDRRTREGKQPKADDKEGTTPTADDPSSQLALRDAFDDATSELKLTKGQRQLLRDAVTLKRLHPSDVDGFVTDYVSRAGWTAPTAQTPSAPAAAPMTPPVPANDRPASDRGSPPPPKVPLHEADLLTMSDSDRQALIKEKGIKWFVEKTRAQAKGRAVATR